MTRPVGAVVAADIDPARLLETILNHGRDVEEFLRHIRDLLQHPERLGLTVS